MLVDKFAEMDFFQYVHVIKVIGATTVQDTNEV